MLDIAYHFSAMDLYDEEFNVVNLGRQNIDERRDEWTHLSPKDFVDGSNTHKYFSNSSESSYASSESLGLHHDGILKDWSDGEVLHPDDEDLTGEHLTIATYVIGTST
jgi:hypothetical protein